MSIAVLKVLTVATVAEPTAAAGRHRQRESPDEAGMDRTDTREMKAEGGGQLRGSDSHRLVGC